MINWLKCAAWFEARLSIVRSIPEFTIGGGDSVVDSDLRMTGLDGPELRSRLLALLNREFQSFSSRMGMRGPKTRIVESALDFLQRPGFGPTLSRWR